MELSNFSSMPISSPSYPKGPYRFINREYFMIPYKTDPAAIRKALPSPLEPDGSNRVIFEFIRMPDSYGFGDYVESGVVIPALYKGEKVNYTAQMYLDCLPPIVAGREIWGFPKKLGFPKIEVESDTLVGTLDYGKQRVATGTMQYKFTAIDVESAAGKEFAKELSKTQVNFKLIPDVTGEMAIAQLVAYNICDIKLKGVFKGPARLHLIPHVQAPLADLPVLEVEEGLHLIADLTLPYGRVLHNYLK